jgi:diguanylate cyclase (GGDEF)-like protein
MVLMPNTDAAGAFAVAQRLRERVETISIPHEGRRVPVTCSIGVSAAVPASADGMHPLVQAADHALYRAKDAGRNRVELAGYPPAA